MNGFSVSLLLAAASLAVVEAVPFAGPKATLDSATVTGTRAGKVSKFLGIPYAQPPVGNLRFRLPEPLDSYTGAFDAKQYGAACTQLSSDRGSLAGLPAETIDFLLNPFFGNVTSDGAEDCLTINVITPSDFTPESGYPVVTWIYGGGFTGGQTSTYDGAGIVKRSIQLGEPIVYVSMNYRLGAFGFLPGKEVKEAKVGNLGMQDQREALRWIQKYIAQFGGDPTKVTLWGESAGAISASLHMLASGGDTEGLYRGAFMQSGSPIPVGDITNYQEYYDAIVEKTGCSGQEDTLQCLREAPYESLKAAADDSSSVEPNNPSTLLVYLPRVDGEFITEPPLQLVAEGKVANVPIISSDCDDEGTLFTLPLFNVTTSADQLRDYIATYWLPNAPSSDIDALLTLYPDDITQGSPFDTGILNAITPEYKRMSAFQGDAIFQAPRRHLFKYLSGKQDIWAFLSKRLKGLPLLGSAHGSDILNIYGGGDLVDYLINFVNTLNPNLGSNITFNWPAYTMENPQLLTLLDSIVQPRTVTEDDYRTEAMDKLNEVLLKYPV